MIKLPNFEEKYDHENNFYLSCDSTRISKAIAQYEIFKRVIHVEGEIVECGVFKGASFSRFAIYRDIHNLENKMLVGFDSFGEFPETKYDLDQDLRKDFIDSAGSQSISKKQLRDVLEYKKCNDNISLIDGDIVETVPKFIEENPEFKISLLNLDVDIYEPTVVILECLYPLIEVGGILILDDYGTFPGETNAVDEFFKDNNVVVERSMFESSPRFIVKK